MPSLREAFYKRENEFFEQLDKELTTLRMKTTVMARLFVTALVYIERLETENAALRTELDSYLNNGTFTVAMLKSVLASSPQTPRSASPEELGKALLQGSAVIGTHGIMRTPTILGRYRVGQRVQILLNPHLPTGPGIIRYVDESDPELPVRISISDPTSEKIYWFKPSRLVRTCLLRRTGAIAATRI